MPIIRHIHEVWCAGDKRLTIYILNWLAFLIQKPDKKPGTAILMCSPPRCGKNILTDFIGECVLGHENFLSTTCLHDVMGKFNGSNIDLYGSSGTDFLYSCIQIYGLSGPFPSIRNL
jgi:hypothetical protein